MGFGGTDKVGPIESQLRLDARTLEGAKEAQDLRHPHGKAFDDYISIKRFQYVTRCKRMINAGIFVWMQTRQVLLANVNHLDCDL